jgi:tryptophanase
VYTSRQLEQAADAVAEILVDPDAVSGLELVAESPVLSHFTAWFKSLTAVAR